MPAAVGVPVLGKRELEGTIESADGDTEAVTPADEESAQEYFAPFLCSDKTTSSYPDFVSIATNLFEPGKFVARAVTAAEEYVASNGGVDDSVLAQTVADVASKGLTGVMCEAQTRLRASGTVLTPESVETVFAGDPEI